LARAGFDLILTDVASCKGLAEKLQLPTNQVLVIEADLSHPDGVAKLLRQVQERHSVVDVLINNAAYMALGPLAQLTLEEFRRFQAINVEAPFLLAQALAPAMQAQRYGRIVNIISGAPWVPAPGFTGYITTKMALLGLTRALAAELGDFGITVNGMTPGLTRHDGTANKLPPEAWEGARLRQAIHRTALPEDAVGLLAFLVSDEAAFLTGQMIAIDGGLISIP
jgi:NAD(P)-dependent dehydrogenase (short-subunit alcohol dehydrogenase family)